MSFNLDDIIAELSKAFGEGSITRASALKPRLYRTSGSIALDLALGGGHGQSTIVDVIGKQSVGKTLLFEMAAVSAQKNENRPSCIFDFEGTFDPKRFLLLGGDPDGLALIRAENFGDGVGPLFLEWAADMLKAQLKQKMFACIALDSTAAMVSQFEYAKKEEKGEEAITMAYTARGMSSILRQIVGTGLVARSDATLFFMSQMRDNIGGRGFKGMPPSDKRTGGRALPFYASTQLEVSRGETFSADVDNEGVITKDAEVGHETKVRVRKNKNNARMGRVAAFDLYSEGEVTGLDRVGELARLSVLTGVVTKNGNYYIIPISQTEDMKVLGKPALHEQLSNDAIFARVYTKTCHHLELQMIAHALPEEVLEGDGPPFDDTPIDSDEALMEKW